MEGEVYEVKLAPLNIISGATNFHNAWAGPVQFVVNHGTYIEFGGAEHKKPAFDSRSMIQLLEPAIEQILRHELHPQYPQRERGLEVYVDEFSRPYVDGQRALPDSDDRKHPYLYAERLMFYPKISGPGIIDEMAGLRENLAKQIENSLTSNRHEAITWQPEKDINGRDPPCLQVIQIRYLGKRRVEAILFWRSRDLFNAWQYNIIGLTEFIKREVIDPNKCRLVGITDICSSLHIEKPHIPKASEVKIIAVNPQSYGREGGWG